MTVKINKIVTHLENMIETIKIKGFEHYNKLILDKEKERSIRKAQVDTLQKQLNYISSFKKKYGTKNSKLEGEMFMYKQISERMNKDMFYSQQELPYIKQEIEFNRNGRERLMRETLETKLEISHQEKEILKIQESIRKVNKANSDVQKEKEILLDGINLLKRQNASLKHKIHTENIKCQEFLTDVSVFVSNLK